MLTKAERGLKFFGNTASSAKDKIITAYQHSELERFISLICILNELSQSKEYSILSSIGYVQKYQDSDFQHLNTILDYLLNNFKKEIKLEEVAKVANMSPTAFCRYFKNHTNKTLIQFTTELRIGYAKKMLVESRDTISTICFETGYNNISNFYDHFYKITGKRPSQFREEHQSKLILT
jgi:AraC-like DNA-binding protein